MLSPGLKALHHRLVCRIPCAPWDIGLIFGQKLILWKCLFWTLTSKPEIAPLVPEHNHARMCCMEQRQQRSIDLQLNRNPFGVSSRQHIEMQSPLQNLDRSNTKITSSFPKRVASKGCSNGQSVPCHGSIGTPLAWGDGIARSP